MTMLNALPSSYHQLVSTIVHFIKTEDFMSTLIRQSILQENSLRKATQFHGSASLASRIGEPAYVKAHQTTIIWNAPTNVKCSKCGKTNHTTDCCCYDSPLFFCFLGLIFCFHVITYPSHVTSLLTSLVFIIASFLLLLQTSLAHP